MRGPRVNITVHLTLSHAAAEHDDMAHWRDCVEEIFVEHWHARRETATGLHVLRTRPASVLEATYSAEEARPDVD